MGENSGANLDSPDHHLYAVLNLPQGASQVEINERYRSLSLAFHPDKQTDPILKEAATKEFLEIQKAYQVLSDPFLRQVYDTLGTAGLSIKWPSVIRSKTKEEIQEILDQGRLDIRRSRLRRFIIPKATYTCSLDASPLFASRTAGFRGTWISRFADRLRATHTINQSLVYAAEKMVSERTSMSLEARSNIGEKIALMRFFGTVRHQFSPRILTLITFKFSHPYVTKLEANYEGPDSSLNFRTAFSPFYLNTLPPTTLSLSRRLFRSRPQFGKISLHIGRRPSISLFFVSPPNPFPEEKGPSLESSPPTTFGFKYLAFEKHIGLVFDAIFPKLVAETSVTFVELSTQLKASIELGFTGAFYSLGAHWSNERAEVRSSLILSATSLLVQIDCAYLEQQLSLPIVLATESSPKLSLATFIVPSTLSLLGYHFFILPRRRAQRKAHIQAAKKAFEEDYDSRRQRNAVEDLLKDTARKQMRQEAERNGLVIQEATYGAEESDLEDLDEKLFLDVTIPVQALVRRSQLYIPGGDSKAALQGFSDPAPFVPKSLRIRYLFRGRQHYAEISDYMPVVLPLAEHQVECGEVEGQPYGHMSASSSLKGNSQISGPETQSIS